MTDDKRAAGVNFGSVVRLNGGVVYTTIGRTVLVQIPSVCNDEAVKSVVSGVFQLYDKTAVDVDWMLDLSGVAHIPMRLLYSFIGHQMSLRSKGSTLNLAWVAPDSLSKASLERAIDVFGMMQSGGFYFSKKIFEKRDSGVLLKEQ